MDASTPMELYPEASGPAERSAPPSLKQRLLPLDVLRGIGVLGALFVSIWMFGGLSDQQQHQSLLTSKGWNYRVYGAVQLLFSGKMLALVALALGASIVIFLNKEHEAGRQPALEVYVKKYLWLIVFGIFNAVVLLWPLDVLFPLGIMAILVFVFFRLKPKGLLIASLLTMAIYCGKYYWDYADDKKAYGKYTAALALEKKYEKDSIAKAGKGIKAKKDTLTKFQKQDKEAWTGLVAGKKVDTKKDAEKNKEMRSGSYAKVWSHLISGTQWRQAGWTYQKGIWYLASLIFLGMLLYKIGFFSGRFSKAQYWLVALTGIGIGLLLGWWRLNYQQISLADYEKYVKLRPLPYLLWYPVEIFSMALGYAALVMALIQAKVFRKIFSAFAAVGKTALSNYFLQTLVCTIFFYGYGMGYYGRLTQFQLYLFAAELILVQTVLSVLWLRRFHYGPVEWLLRRLAYGKWLPRSFRKPSAEQPLTVLS